jgi:2'-hydroxyisoflavone reductase
MRLLVLGGTQFVGYAIVDAALAAGWQVDTFNRGASGSDAAGVRAIRGDRAKAADVQRLAATDVWDAVVDTSGYVPQNTLAVARALVHSTGRYVFMSTVSVYRGWPVESLSEESEVLPCPSDAGDDYGEDTEDGPTSYGYQKAGCENAVRAVFGEDRTTILRPGVVLGPREYVGRLPWWLRRVAAGGRVVAPGSPARTLQPVDVRDLASFTLHAIEQSIAGVYNATAPFDHATFGGMLADCAEVTGAEGEFVWVPDDQLLMHGVRQWSEMPLWRVSRGVWAVDSSRSWAAGMTCRPLAETVRDTWDWLIESDEALDNDRASEIGLTADHERAILAWYDQNSR